MLGQNDSYHYLFLLNLQHDSCVPVALRMNPRNLLFRYASEQIQHPDAVCSAVYLGAARTYPDSLFTPDLAR